jgi:hypothetical protein
MTWLFEVVIEDERDSKDIKTERHYVEAECIFDVANDFWIDNHPDTDRSVISIVRHVPISRRIIHPAEEV